MTTILTVCVGNLCRSPLAERLLAARADELGVPLTVSSAGLEAVVGAPMERPAAAELVRLGGSADGFVARRLTDDLVAGADIVLTATKQVRTATLQVAPAAMRRTFTVLEFAGICEALAEEPHADASALVTAAARSRGRVAGRDLDLVDPIKKSAAVHREVADAISGAVDSILAKLRTLG